MALVLADRVRETTTVVGTGTATLLGAVAGYQSFTAVGNANTTYYVIASQSAGEWEVGIGTYTASGTTLSRDTVLSSSNAGSLVNFSAGTKDIWVDYAAGKAVTTDTLAYPPVIGSTTPAAATFTTLTATGQTSLGGAAGSESFRAYVASTSGSRFATQVNTNVYFGVDGTATPLIANTNGGIFSVRTSAIGGTGNEQLRVSNTASAVNYVQVTGAATGGRPTISAQGSDAAITLGYAAKGSGGGHIFTTNGNRALQIDDVASAVNNFAVRGGATTQEPVMSVVGNDTNISMAFQSKGTGAIDLAAGSSGVNISNGGTVTAITRTAVAVNYTTIPSAAVSAPTTAGGVQATAAVNMFLNTATVSNGGTGYTVGDVLTLVGGTPTGSAATITVTAVTGGVITSISSTNFAQYSALPTNPVSVTGGTGAGATFTPLWGNGTVTITNAGSGYVEQPTVTFSGGGGSGAAAYASVGAATTLRSLAQVTNFDTSGGTQFQIQTTSGGNAYPFATGGTNGAAFGIAGAATNAGFLLTTRGTGNHDFYTNSFAQLQARIAHTASAVNYVQVTGAATGNPPVLSVQGSDSSIAFRVQAKGAGAVAFIGGSGGILANITGSSGTGRNYLQFESAATTVAPVLSAQGTDTNVGMNLTTKGTGALSVNTGGGEQFRVSNVNSAVNYVQAYGSVTGGAVSLESAGTDPNIWVNYGAKGTGNHQFLTNNAVQARIAHTASAVNYVQVTGAATGGTPTISAQGSDSNISLFLNAKGTGNVFLQVGGANVFQAAGSSTSANRILTQANNAGTAPAIQSVGSDTNINLNLITKGTGALSVNTGGGLAVTVVDSGGTTANYIQMQGRQTGNGPIVSAQGTDSSANLEFQAKGTGGNIRLFAGVAEQVRIAPTASAVNYVQVTGGATGVGAALTSQGSDTNVDLLFGTRGRGAFVFRTSTSVRQFQINDVISAVNFLQVGGAVAGAAPVLSAAGTDTNIPLVVQPKGTGALQAQLNDGTATGGNARGANAVDWQTSRSNASEVCSAQFGGVLSGRNNTASAFSSNITGGQFNIAQGNFNFVGGGSGNSANGNFLSSYSAIVGGNSNQANGIYNFIGGGFTNSGTSSAAVTTQSATMNGTTAVTLSGSNASIRVGQIINGTSIAPETYVAAISGTSLTLSKVASGSSTSTLSFFTPHGVVVGGGNNQATGAYSFIGGGGDAGTAANRNVASGDWSTVAGGINNRATGVGSFIGGGGTFGFVSGNAASAAASALVGGLNNLTSGFASFIGGGNTNQATGQYSSIMGGAFGTTRGITSNNVFGSNPIGSTVGLSQAALLVLGKETTNATATVITSDGNAAGTANQVILPNNSAYFFRGEVVSGVTGGGNTKGWTIEGVIKRGANAASTALVGTPMVTSAYGDVGASTWTIAVTADTTNGGLAVTFTGQAGTTIRTVAQIRTTEMTF